MAVGDDAANLPPASGGPLDLVHETDPRPDPSDSAYIRWGAREINKTRDYIKTKLLDILKPSGSDVIWSIAQGGTGASTKSDARTNLGITSGASTPASPAEGDLHFTVV